MSNAGTHERVREYPFTDRDFGHVKKLIYRHAGISLSDGKQDMVYSRLARRLRDHGMTSFSDYLDLLADADSPEWQSFTNALTTHLSSFFREAHHFPLLAEHLAMRAASGEPMTIWCCAASTGEEPYTIAMTVAETLGDDASARILATDVDTDVLARADAGVYDLDRIASLSAERQRRFFLRGTGPHAGSVKVRPELRRTISFKPLNLLDERWAMRGPFDVIMCRNVMIYFDKDTQRRILERFAPLLRSDGLLFAGHSESFFHATDLFKLRGKTVYQLADPARRHGAR